MWHRTVEIGYRGPLVLREISLSSILWRVGYVITTTNKKHGIQTSNNNGYLAKPHAWVKDKRTLWDEIFFQSLISH